MKKPIVIRRIFVPKYLGVCEAAKQLGVSRQAVSNYLTGRKGSSIGAEKIARLKVISEK